MKIRFLKKLAKNLFYLFANFGLIYAFMQVADRYLGESIWGMLAYLIFLIILVITGMSWSEALFDEKWENSKSK